VAKQVSRKISLPKKPAGGRIKAAAVAVKAKASKPAPVVAKAKPATKSVPAALPKRAAAATTTKTNGTSKPVIAAKATVSAKAPVNAKASAKSVAAKPSPIKSRGPEPRRLETMPPPRPMPIPEAVPTNGKPRKNQAGLSSKELEHFRDLLLEKRRELVGDMYSMESEALRTDGSSNLSSLPIHMADMGTDNYEQEFTLGLVEKERGLLREINSALAKIQNGTYGICEGTGNPISKPRLEAQPWARHSIEYARQTQRPMGMGRVG
jgi:DnaK suppressor protein